MRREIEKNNGRDFLSLVQVIRSSMGNFVLITMSEIKKMHLFSHSFMAFIFETKCQHETSEMLVNSNHKLTDKGKCSIILVIEC